MKMAGANMKVFGHKTLMPKTRYAFHIGGGRGRFTEALIFCNALASMKSKVAFENIRFFLR
ncbi:hypothetical protein CPA45_18625 [Vreelandella nigrificans]|uniref:Uncharacterized protein n=1 Tax=Vreelandella nigrificans TaxID=2042704 RepID=A0A2A4HJC0_9GAMM|nr:hypothetical protein CPA45_18625 [Halomonas nigrificans]